MSTFDASEFESASRSDLIARAEGLGIDKADVLTRAELIDEIVKRSVGDPIERRLARGLLGAARDLVARVVERGLHLPDAAALIRGLQHATLTPITPPIATVTLAEIYAGQGHRARALAVLDEVLAHEPDHDAAVALREKIATLPEDVAPISSSAPPPEVPSAPPPGADALGTAAGDRETQMGHELAQDREHGDDVLHAEESEPARDTLPPEADFSPTLIPEDRSPPTLRVDAPEAFIAHGEDFESSRITDRIASSSRTTDIAAALHGELDSLVLVPIGATNALACWETSETALAEVRARAEAQGELILRIVAVTPSWDGPTTEIRDIEIASPSGDWWVCDLPAGAVLRGAIGWRAGSSFEPLAVALDVIAHDEHLPTAANDVGPPETAHIMRRRAGMEERARRRAEQGRGHEGRAASSWRALALAPWEAPYEATHPPNA